MARFWDNKSIGALLVVASLAAALPVVGCHESGANGERDGSSEYGSTDGGDCERREQAYQSFLRDHQDCERDSDCAVIGDCGPNADFAAVRADAASRARELQEQRCPGAWDGPVYSPVCREGRCALEMIPDDCCGCPDLDDDAG